MEEPKQPGTDPRPKSPPEISPGEQPEVTPMPDKPEINPVQIPEITPPPEPQTPLEPPKQE